MSDTALGLDGVAERRVRRAAPRVRREREQQEAQHGLTFTAD